jgi:biopolymer transport protein ExbD
MRFLVRKRRQTPAVIIVALIDVLIVLLIFLMVTTTFKQQPALRLVLPESSQAKKTGANENAPLIVSIDAQGGLRFGPNAQPLTPDQLKSELASEVEKDPNLKVGINADKSAPIGEFIKVMDAAMEAHVKPGMINVFTKEAPKP